MFTSKDPTNWTIKSLIKSYASGNFVINSENDTIMIIIDSSTALWCNMNSKNLIELKANS